MIRTVVATSKLKLNSDHHLSSHIYVTIKTRFLPRTLIFQEPLLTPSIDKIVVSMDRLWQLRDHHDQK